MAEFAYTTVPGKIPALLQKLREIGVPQKVSAQWLKTIGFTSSNDTSLIGVLKQVGLVDSSSIPTSIWTQYRGNAFKKVLGTAIRQGYAERFAVYPDAPTRSGTELEHVFSTSSSAGKQVIGKTVSTFKALADSAEFDEQPEQITLSADQTALHKPIGSAAAQPTGNQRGPTTPSVHIDIQIHIAPEASTDQIDQIFRSMSKHLYGTRDSG
jgi:Family of unknown function (DUF5343)